MKKERIMALTSYAIIFLYILLFIRMLQINFDIRATNYLFITGSYLAALFLFAILRILIKVIPQLFIFLTLVTLLVALTIFFGRYNLFEIINKQIIVRLITTNKTFAVKKYIDFYEIYPVLIIGVVIISLILLIANILGQRLISLIIIITVPFYIWANGGNNSLEYYIYFLAFLTVFQVGIATYYKQKRISKKQDVLYKINYKKTLKYSLVASIASLGFILICLNLFGVQSLSQRNRETEDTAIMNLNFAQSNYNISQSGYGGGYAGYKGLGGPVKLNNTIAFKVKSDKPYYLRGSVMDDYDGFSWRSSDSETKKQIGSQVSQSYGTKELIIYPQGIATKTFFTPLNTIQVKYKNGNIVEGKESTYSTGLSDENISSYYSLLFEDSSSNQVADYELAGVEKNKYMHYLLLPENISKETRNLVETVIGSSTKNSDKVEKIKEYLMKNYKYSLNVSKIPQGKEFVDYFLFKEKKGYCTYFASAMTIMCRIAGVPARYVEGFFMNDTKDSDGLYVVSNDRAHAWTEVLTDPVENVWVSVDSTPNQSVVSEEKMKDSKATVVVNTKGSLNNISGPLLICFSTVTIIIGILIYRIKRFLWKKDKVIMSKSTFPTYIFILKRLAVAKEVIPAHFSDNEFVESLNDVKVKNEMREIVLAYYDEFYGDIKENNLDNKKIIKVIEEYVYRKIGIIKYYMSIILFK